MADSPLPPVSALPPPPPALLTDAALFLDFDGTLVPIADTPDGVDVDAGLITLLAGLRDALQGRLAIVSGRSVATLRDLGLGDFLLAGTHGLEFAQPGEGVDAAPRLAAIDDAEAAFNALAAEHPALLVERKSVSVGLHFRAAPDLADACDALARILADAHGLFVQHGKMLVELRPGGADKGSAVYALMTRAPMTGGTPLFFGDDVTDEEGFAAAIALGGQAVLVGAPRATAAHYALEQVAAVRHYLSQAVGG